MQFILGVEYSKCVAAQALEHSTRVNHLGMILTIKYFQKTSMKTELNTLKKSVNSTKGYLKS